MQATFLHPGKTIDYTPGSAVAAGQVVVIGLLVGIALRPIASGEQGAVTIEGVFALPEKDEVIANGAYGYWDADGNPDVGTAGSGAITATKANGVFAGIKVPYAGTLPAGSGAYKLVQSEDTDTISGG